MSAVYKRFKLILLVIALLATSGLVQSAQAAEGADSTKAFNASEVILHHVLDDHIWHFFDGHYGTWYLPIIVYTKERGLESFSSHHFYNENHEVVPYNGYKLDHNHIYLEATGEQ
ncbi:MAG: F0F1 ATP synthase subunit A, partial [Chryseotalea sp.]